MPKYNKTTNSSLNTVFIWGTSIGGVIYGYNLGAISGALLIIKNTIAMTQAEASFFVASFFWGIGIILIIAGYLANKIGRKNTLLTGTTIALLSTIALITATNVYQLIVARFLTGIATGILNVGIPLYISETIPAKYRGRALLFFQLLVCFGILFSTIVSFIAYHSNTWRYIFAIEIIPILVLLSTSIFLIESPRWLLLKNKLKEATIAVNKLFSVEEAELILNSSEKLSANLKLSSIVKNKQLLLPTLFVIMLGALNQLTGINVFLQYDSNILMLSKFNSHSDAILGSIAITALNFSVTFIAMFIVDKIERRKLLQIGLIGLIICLLLSGLSICYSDYIVNSKSLVLFGLLGIIMFFAIGPGALTWALLAEMLPTSVRSIGMSVALSISSLTAAALTSIFLPLQYKLGLGNIFFACCVFVIIYFLASFLIPDIRGKSLEMIEIQARTK